MENTYINTPFNYTGSKFKLLPQILPLFDYRKSMFVDLFTGGGSVYTNIVDKFDKVLINDIIPELIEIHKQILKPNFIEKVKQIVPPKDDQEMFLQLRKSFNEEKTPEKLYALMLSSTNNMIIFNKKFEYNQTFGKRSFNNSTQLKIDQFINTLKDKDNIFYSHKHFIEIPIKQNIFYYVDPPYSNTEAGYNSYWNKDDDVRLFNYLLSIDKIGSSFAVSGVLSHNDTPCVLLDLLIENKFKLHELEHNYSKVARDKSDKKTVEVLITNY
jgi:DNA adenine methylase Dam